MQKTIINILLLSLIQQTVIDQTKPTLPFNFFDVFNYSLSNSFNYNDSAALVAEIKNMAIIELNFQNMDIYIKKISKGSKLRLIFQSINNPWHQKNNSFEGDVSKESTSVPRIIEARILMGGKYASKIVLPNTKIK